MTTVNLNRISAHFSPTISIEVPEYWLAEANTGSRLVGGVGSTADEAIEDFINQAASVGTKINEVQISIS